MTQDYNVVYIKKAAYRKCRGKCKKLKKLNVNNFYQKQTKSGRIIYEHVCKKCRQDTFAELYKIKKEVIKELVTMPSTSGFFADQACSNCAFVFDCNYKVKLAKSLDSPYCFADSRFHHLFVQKYGKE